MWLNTACGRIFRARKPGRRPDMPKYQTNPVPQSDTIPRQSSRPRPRQPPKKRRDRSPPRDVENSGRRDDATRQKVAHPSISRSTYNLWWRARRRNGGGGARGLKAMRERKATFLQESYRKPVLAEFAGNRPPTSPRSVPQFQAATQSDLRRPRVAAALNASRSYSRKHSLTLVAPIGYQSSLGLKRRSRSRIISTIVPRGRTASGRLSCRMVARATPAPTPAPMPTPPSG
jgi:hypothetical protein